MSEPERKNVESHNDPDKRLLLDVLQALVRTQDELDALKSRAASSGMTTADRAKLDDLERRLAEYEQQAQAHGLPAAPAAARSFLDSLRVGDTIDTININEGGRSHTFTFDREARRFREAGGTNE